MQGDSRECSNAEVLSAHTVDLFDNTYRGFALLLSN